MFWEFADSLDKRKKFSKVPEDKVHYSLTCTVLSIRKTTVTGMAILVTIAQVSTV